jgi:hypothetical protein
VPSLILSSCVPPIDLADPYADTGIDLTLAGVLTVKATETGELGASSVAGIGGGGGMARLGTTLESLDLDRWSAAFRVADRRPAGNEDLGLEAACGTLPEVAGLCPSNDGRGRGPSLTFGLEYCA